MASTYNDYKNFVLKTAANLEQYLNTTDCSLNYYCFASQNFFSYETVIKEPFNDL